MGLNQRVRLLIGIVCAMVAIFVVSILSFYLFLSPKIQSPEEKDIVTYDAASIFQIQVV